MEGDKAKAKAKEEEEEDSLSLSSQHQPPLIPQLQLGQSPSSSAPQSQQRKKRKFHKNVELSINKSNNISNSAQYKQTSRFIREYFSQNKYSVVLRHEGIEAFSKIVEELSGYLLQIASNINEQTSVQTRTSQKIISFEEILQAMASLNLEEFIDWEEIENILKKYSKTNKNEESSSEPQMHLAFIEKEEIITK